MWVRVRTFDAKITKVINGISKLTSIFNLKKLIREAFSLSSNDFNLFYRGKQLEDLYTIHDYEVGLNDIIQLMIKSSFENNHTPELITNTNVVNDKYLDCYCSFQKHSLVDIKDEDSGAWFEGVIISIKINSVKTSLNVQYLGYDKISDVSITNQDCNNLNDNELANISSTQQINFLSKLIRPRSTKIINSDSLYLGQSVLVNYNIDKPNDRGFWYEGIISRRSASQRRKDIFVNIYLGEEESQILRNCRIKFFDEIYEINNQAPTDGENELMSNKSLDLSTIKTIRKLKYDCDFCHDDPGKTCKECHCNECGKKDNLEKQLMCDECDKTYHSYCVDPPIGTDEFPSSDEDWYCPDCKLDENEVVKPGDAKGLLRDIVNKKRRKRQKTLQFLSTKRNADTTDVNEKVDDRYVKSEEESFNNLSDGSDMESNDKTSIADSDYDSDYLSTSKSKRRTTNKKKNYSENRTSSAKVDSPSTFRDWGRGMACVGRTKICNLVPPNHFGPIPGVPVGSCWKYRLQVSECGIHRPHVAGIHGREDDGAYSIVLSGGYEDDEDFGEEFYYTGSGGRDLSGNKRTAEQSFNQKLTKQNRALAKNCDCEIDEKNGGEAKNWKDGLPIRVVRNYKGSKNSKYAPEEGNRYDGIYKVIKYWPQIGKSGFKVWRYLLKRDDPEPAPWTTEGKEIIEQFNLTMQLPDGYDPETENISNSCKTEQTFSPMKTRNKAISQTGDDEKTETLKLRKSIPCYLKVSINNIIKKRRKSNQIQGDDKNEAENDALDEEVYSDDEETEVNEGNKENIISFSRKLQSTKDVADGRGKALTEINLTFKLPPLMQKKIEKDIANRKTWSICLMALEDGIQAFLTKVLENFECICCKELVYEPVTTTCNHNFCQSCLQLSIKNGCQNCPTCRLELGKLDGNVKYKYAKNEKLQEILEHIIPGYGKGKR